MKSVQVKNVPEDTHAVLRIRAAAAGMSLQEHLLRHLIDAADRPTLDEVLARAGDRGGGRLSLEAAADMVRAGGTDIPDVDFSVLVAAIVDGAEDGSEATARLQGNTLTAPALVDLEMLSVLRRLNSSTPDCRCAPQPEPWCQVRHQTA